MSANCEVLSSVSGPCKRITHAEGLEARGPRAGFWNILEESLFPLSYLKKKKFSPSYRLPTLTVPNAFDLVPH